MHFKFASVYMSLWWGMLSDGLGCIGCFQDIALPYMLDKRHCQDTFFICAEADHRFYPDDCLTAAEWLEVSSGVHFGQKEWEEKQAEPSAGSSTEPSAGSSTEPSAGGNKGWTETQAEHSSGKARAFGAWTAGKKEALPREQISEQVSDELKGLVAIANQATRRGCGDLVWFSWNPDKRPGHKRQPGFGSQLVGVRSH